MAAYRDPQKPRGTSACYQLTERRLPQVAISAGYGLRWRLVDSQVSLRQKLGISGVPSYDKGFACLIGQQRCSVRAAISAMYASGALAFEEYTGLRSTFGIP